MPKITKTFTDKLLARGCVWVAIDIKKDHEQAG